MPCKKKIGKKINYKNDEIHESLLNAGMSMKSVSTLFAMCCVATPAIQAGKRIRNGASKRIQIPSILTAITIRRYISLMKVDAV